MGKTLVSREMCFFCFDVLKAHLNKSAFPTPRFSNEPHPIFVTWKVAKDQSLRGCVGTFESSNLHEGLKEYAITSACRDPRFPPISLDEIPKLQVAVSVLFQFEDANDYLDWTIGLHGILIRFDDANGSEMRATYLPDFVRDKGPDAVKTIDALLRKGGFKGTITEELRKSIRLTRYQTQKETVTFDEYEKSTRNNEVPQLPAMLSANVNRV